MNSRFEPRGGGGGGGGRGGGLGHYFGTGVRASISNLPHSYTWRLKKKLTHSYTRASELLIHSYTAR